MKLFLAHLALGLTLAGCGAAQPAPMPAGNPTSTAPTDDPETPRRRADAIEPVPGPVSPEARAIVDAADRTKKDRDRDARRHPGELLTFIGVRLGWHVADLGAGDGYTTELLARAVGREGRVFAQNNAHTLENFVKEAWPERLEREINKNVVRVDRQYDDPFPEEAVELDLVTVLFSYHDVVAQELDVAKMNAKVFAALKPGGLFVIADHSASPGSGIAAAGGVHRLEEAIVKEQVQAAGFELVGEAQFLRDPEDLLGKPSFRLGFETDRYLLKFAKPK